LVIAFIGVFSFGFARAEQLTPTAIGQGITDVSVVDSDSDGLSDQLEIKTYKTDPKKADTDGDGFFDGTEVTVGTDPLDAKIFPGMPSEQELNPKVKNENPLPWYIVRASGFVAFSLLYLSILLGLTIRVPFLHKLFAPLYAMQGHCWIAFQAILFALIHGVMLMFDTYTKFRFVDVFIMYASPISPGLVAFGIAAFYLMIIVTASSYARKFISQKTWRTMHFLNIILYIFVIIHAYKLGTDMQNDTVRIVFMSANGFLVLLMFFNMFSRIIQNISRKKDANAASGGANMIRR